MEACGLLNEAPALPPARGRTLAASGLPYWDTNGPARRRWSWHLVSRAGRSSV